MSDNASAVAATLQNHPRLVGALFTLTCLIASSGSAAAGFAANSGP